MGYLEEARARARRRKSRWNFLLIPASLLPLILIWATLALLGEQAHTHLYPGESLRTGGGLWVVVAVVAPFFAALPIGMLVGNFLVYQLPQVRDILDREAFPDPTLSYAGSQATLRKVAFFAAVGSLVVTTLGVLLPW